MKVMIDICVSPANVGLSVSAYVAECQKIIRGAGLDYHMHGYGTNIEGEWDEVMAVVKACHEKMHEMGVQRCGSTLRVGTRIDRGQSIQDKISSVEDKLAAE